MKSLNAFARGVRRAHSLWLALALPSLIGACDRYTTTGIAEPRILPVETDRAVVTREGKHLRIKLKKRQTIAPAKFGEHRDSTWFDRGNDVNVATILSPNYRVLPGAVPVASAAAPDTADVSVVSHGELVARGSTFAITVTLSGSVTRGQSTYPLYRAANGWLFSAYVNEPTGGRLYASRKSCYDYPLWDYPLQQCMLDLWGLERNGFITSTYSEVQVGSRCPYSGHLDTNGGVAFYATFSTDERLRQRDERHSYDSRSADIEQRCFDAIQQLCDDPSYCSSSEGGGGDGGGSASVEGQTQFTPLSTPGSTSAFSDHFVCDVVDWYIWTSFGYTYTDTVIQKCWWERW